MPKYSITASSASIGSADSNAIVIREPRVAPRHAVITLRGKRHYVADAGSDAGTFLNRHQVLAPTPIANDDLLTVGSVEFLCVGFSSRRPEGWLERHLNEALLVISGLVILLIIYFYGFQVVQRLLSYSRPPPAEPPVAAAWLNMVNHYRARAHLTPVAGDLALSNGDLGHVKYLLQNSSAPILSGENLGAALHFEHPGLAGYSPGGGEAALQSNVVAYGTGLAAGRRPPLWAIDNFMATVFGRLAILNPQLARVGYAEACLNGACAAALNIAGGRGPLEQTLPDPIEYPPDAATVSRSAIAAETPDPLSACAGYSGAAGLPITLQLAPWTAPRLERYALTRASLGAKPAVKEAACGFDAATYVNPGPAQQWLGRALLKNYGAVVIIPRQALKPRSHYFVAARVDGRVYRWSFFTARETPP